MEAYELMLGDWVYGINDPYNPDAPQGKYPVRVTRLGTGDDIMTDYYAPMQDPDEYGECDDWYDIEPIPLTAEILEKNGFDQNGIGRDVIEIIDPDYSDETYVWQKRDEYDNLFTVSLYDLNDGNGGWLCEIVDSPKGKMDIEIKSVHQLQHVLRLCGIEKEIILCGKSICKDTSH